MLGTLIWLQVMGGPIALYGSVHCLNTSGPSLTKVVYAYFDLRWYYLVWRKHSQIAARSVRVLCGDHLNPWRRWMCSKMRAADLGLPRLWLDFDVSFVFRRESCDKGKTEGVAHGVKDLSSKTMKNMFKTCHNQQSSPDLATSFHVSQFAQQKS